ncbi:MAG: hypothetical protein JEZ06_08855 [Anaerolineaceae bacterium]|nr:hypothetical protein [Anaerolineaceae bacterium]
MDEVETVFFVTRIFMEVVRNGNEHNDQVIDELFSRLKTAGVHVRTVGVSSNKKALVVENKALVSIHKESDLKKDYKILTCSNLHTFQLPVGIVLTYGNVPRVHKIILDDAHKN